MFGALQFAFRCGHQVAVVFRGLECKISYDMVRRIKYLVVVGVRDKKLLRVWVPRNSERML